MTVKGVHGIKKGLRTTTLHHLMLACIQGKVCFPEEIFSG